MLTEVESSARADEIVRRVRLPNGSVRVERRDLLKRPRRFDEPDGSVLRYRYDLQGRLTGVRHSSGEWVDMRSESGTLTAATQRTRTCIETSEQGLPILMRQRVDDVEWTVAYRRDAQGQVTAIRYPGSDAWTSPTRLLKASHSTEHVTAEFPSGLRTTEQYREGRLCAVEYAGRRAEIAFDEQGRVARIADYHATYDASGRLQRWNDREYAYDDAGRLVRTGDVELAYGSAPMVLCAGAVRFEYDALGRRSRRHDRAGTTRYAYNLFGQIAEVVLPDGGRVEYVYDGFGRLVARAVNGVTTYFVCGIDGERLAEAAADGRIIWSYLWWGAQCIAQIEGPAPGPIVASYHRLCGGRLAAVGDARGAARLLPLDDPYGADLPIEHGVPGFASLFGDPLTGLVLAGWRWYDPALAQFTSADSWFGGDPGEALPAKLRSVLDALPGGTAIRLSPLDAYVWCRYDPLNLVDRNGHNAGGLVWSTFSALFWNLQLTSIAGQMELLNILIDTLLVVAFSTFSLFAAIPVAVSDSSVLRDLWGWYWRWSIYNLAPPVGSVRIGAFGLVLNGLLKIQPDRAWTLGNVIWERGSELREIEEKGARDLVICSNAASYLASAAVVSAVRVRNPRAKVTGTVPAAGTRIDGATWDPVGAAPPLSDGFQFRDSVIIRAAGAPFDEVRMVSATAGATITLIGPALDAAFHGAVEAWRLDFSFVELSRDGFKVGRSIKFIRGDAIHLPGPGGATAPAESVPRELPADGLLVRECVPARAPESATTTGFPIEFTILRLQNGDDHDGYNAGDFLRIQHGEAYHARSLARKLRRRDVEIDAELPALPGSGRYTDLKLHKMTSSGSAAGQAAFNGAGGAARQRVGLGALARAATPPQKRDGLAVADTGPSPSVERRIITELRLVISVDPLPAALHGVAVKLDHLALGSVSAAAAMDGASGRELTTAVDAANRFSTGQPVRVTIAPAGADGYGVIDAISGGNQIRLVDALPVASFGAGVAVRVRLLERARSYEPENIVAPGNQVVIRESDERRLLTNEVVRVRLAADDDGGAVRRILSDAVTLAQLNTALPATHAAALRVEHFRPVDDSGRTSVTAPDVRRKLVFGSSVPYATGALLHLEHGPEQTIVEVASSQAGGTEIVLTEPVEGDFSATTQVTLLELTGTTTANAHLDSARVLPPSHMDVELSRREALEHHELQHVWQGAVWGPFLLSLPLTWLVHIGFSFSDLSASDAAIARHVSIGGIDSLFAALFYGMADGPGSTTLTAVVDAGLKSVTLTPAVDAGEAGKFSERSRVTLKRPGESRDALNFVESLDTSAQRITLRYALDSDEFAQHFAASETVEISVSPFENIRHVVNTIFSPHQLWIDHIPAAWGRALAGILNRDAWFPFLGIYPLSLLVAGFQEIRLPNEQDAAYHSGDLYTSIVKADPHEIYVGQLSRVYAFIQSRVGGLRSLGAPLYCLEVDLPAVAGMTPAQVASKVHGTTLHGARIRFRDHRYLPMKSRAANVVGALFSTSQKGDYPLFSSGMLPPGTDVVFTGAFPVGFLQQNVIKVRELGVEPSPSRDYYETEVVDFAITGDPQASYELRPKAGAPNIGVIAGLRYRIPALAAAAASPHTDTIEIHCRYDPADAIFDGPGQQARASLPAAELTNFCEEHALGILRISTPAFGPIRAGATHDFQTDITPVQARVTSPLPAGATVNASVSVRERGEAGQPARLRFTAPDAVSASGPVSCELVFGSDPGAGHRRTITFDVTVDP
jgi:YD repeat-containing protein